MCVGLFRQTYWHAFKDILAYYFMVLNSWILPVNKQGGGCEVWIFINKRERGGGRLGAWWGGGGERPWVPHGLKSHGKALRHAEDWVYIVTALSWLLENFFFLNRASPAAKTSISFSFRKTFPEMQNAEDKHRTQELFSSFVLLF